MIFVQSVQNKLHDLSYIIIKDPEAYEKEEKERKLRKIQEAKEAELKKRQVIVLDLQTKQNSNLLITCIVLQNRQIITVPFSILYREILIISILIL